MNKNCRGFTRLLALALCFSLLLSAAACGQDPSKASSKEAQASSARDTLSDPEKPSKVTLDGSAEIAVPGPSVGIIDDPKGPVDAQVSPGTVKAGNLIEGISPEPVEGKAADDRFNGSQYGFAAELMRRSYKADGGNCLVSPLSVVLALAMTANGAAGETLSQMLDVLGSGMTADELNAYLYAYVRSLPSSDLARLAIANSIWLNQKDGFSVREEFLRKDASWYQADVYKLPFNEAAVREVNGWVSKNTDKMIEGIIDKLNEEDRLLLINAICFDAKWADPYPEYSVQDQPFTRQDGSKQTVHMMHSQEKEYFEGEDYTGFSKSYDGYSYKFVAILPDKDTTLDEFMAGLDGEKLSEIMDSATHTKVNAGLPKFSYDYSAGLKERLQDMGIVNAFTDDPSRPDFADFSLISDTDPLYISEVIHKTFIDVEEGGTRAAAVTAVEVAAAAAMPTEPPKQVILDRPFLYMIADSSNNLPIFIGTVNSVD